MNYTPSPHINPDKVFLINRSELEGRFDATYYKLKERILRNFKFPLEKLGNSFFIKDGDHDKLPENAIADSFKGKRYLRAQDLKANSIIDENPIFVTETYFQNVKRCHIYPGDLLFSIMASLGSTAIVPENYPVCTANRAVGILRQKDKSKLLPKFVQALLDTNLGFSLLELEKRGAIQQRLNLSDLATLKLPAPDIAFQNEIVQVYNNGVKIKQQKETEAKALLDSIDDYLLGELGISLPEVDNSLANRIFISKYSEITAGRFDSYYYQKHFKEFFALLSKSKYQVSTIAEIAKKIASGITPLSGGDAYTSAELGIPFIRSGNIDIDGDIDFDDLLYLKPEIHNKVMKSSKLLKNDLMIAIVGATIGQVGIYLDEREANINQAIALVRLKAGINHSYVKELLKSSIGQMNLNRLKRPVARANINLEEISSMAIVLPPLEKQNEIADHIQGIRGQAKALQLEAAQALETAKQQVEKMILGE